MVKIPLWRGVVVLGGNSVADVCRGPYLKRSDWPPQFRNGKLARSTKCGGIIVESSPFMQWVSKLVKDQDRAPLQNRVERGQRKKRR